MNNMKINEIAERIKALREILDITPEEMAEVTKLPIEEYLAYENGERDFSFNFLYNCSVRFGVDLTEIITGENPRLNLYSLTRAGKGLPLERRQGFKYLHMAPMFKERKSEPFIVTAPYKEEEQDKEIVLNSHKGQELDYIIKGSLKVNIDGHIEIMNEGDLIYYDSSHPHGMIAVGGQECVFMAFILK